MSDPRGGPCWDCGGRGRVCPSQPDKCDGCEDCERCAGTGADPGTPHPYLTSSVADPARRG